MAGTFSLSEPTIDPQTTETISNCGRVTTKKRVLIAEVPLAEHAAHVCWIVPMLAAKNFQPTDAGCTVTDSSC